MLTKQYAIDRIWEATGEMYTISAGSFPAQTLYNCMGDFLKRVVIDDGEAQDVWAATLQYLSDIERVAHSFAESPETWLQGDKLSGPLPFTVDMEREIIAIYSDILRSLLLLQKTYGDSFRADGAIHYVQHVELFAKRLAENVRKEERKKK